MLLEFSIKNYKSFRNETVLSFEPAMRQRYMKYTLLREKAAGKTYGATSVAVILGPNAAGKTNIVAAMDTFRSIVLRGNIRNADADLTAIGSQRAASMQLELVPNMHEDPSVQTSFDVAFVADGFLVEYGFDADLGGFLDREHPRRILREELKLNGRFIFRRTPSGVEWSALGQIPKKARDMSNAFPGDYEVVARVTGKSVQNEELLLTNGFRTSVNSKLAELVTNWLKNKLIVLFLGEGDFEPLNASQISSDTVHYMEQPQIAKLIEKMGLSSHHLGFVTPDGETAPVLFSRLKSPQSSADGIIVPARAFESLGTVLLANLMQTILSTLATGSVLVADELDASLHPTAMRAIVNLFHNDDINRNNAQLIFNTHNPIYLDRTLCRRDELWFVDRENETTGSAQWSLADFGTKGSSGVRISSDYLRNYLKGTYGAVADLDLSDLVEEAAQ